MCLSPSANNHIPCRRRLQGHEPSFAGEKSVPFKFKDFEMIGFRIQLSPQPLSLRKGYAYGLPYLCPNSIGSLRQKAGASETNSVAVPCISSGRVINRPGTLTLRTPSRVCFSIYRRVRTLCEGLGRKWCAFNIATFRIREAPVCPWASGKNTQFLMKDYNIPSGYSGHHIELDKHCREGID
ncbi:hypothetical protein TNCV_2643361 [Trichonephila clavipes]|nr:hypothetical protein TNCV_2643361 [Trichonephila clavipes]